MDPNLADVEELVEGAQLVVHFEGFPRPERGIVKKIEKGPRKDLIMETFFEDGTTVVCTVNGNGMLWEAWLFELVEEFLKERIVVVPVLIHSVGVFALKYHCQ